MTPETPVEPRIPGADDFPAQGPNSLASVGQRALARCIDLAIVAVPAILLVIPFIVVEGDQARIEAPAWVKATALVIAVLYEVSLIAWRGQTIGKWVMGVRVARYADGKHPTVIQSSLRSLLPASFVAMPFPIINMGWLVIFLSAGYRPLRRGWHDDAGGTVVVRTR